MSQEEKTIEQEYEDELFSIREPNEVSGIKGEIEYIKQLVSFASTDVGKQLISERERQIPALFNKLFSQLKDPNLNQIVSLIIQLKYAMRDLVDFKGATSALEEKQIILDSLIKKKD